MTSRLKILSVVTGEACATSSSSTNLWQTAGFCVIIQEVGLWWSPVAGQASRQPSPTRNALNGYAMQPSSTEEALLDRQMDEICQGLIEAVDREVESLRREGLPIYVAENGRIVDLQTTPFDNGKE